MDANVVERHYGKGKIYEFTNEDGVVDKIEFKPLGAEYLADLFAVIKAIKKSTTSEDVINTLDDVTLPRLQRLIGATVKNAMPDIPDDKRSQFIMQNFPEMMTVVFELNNFGAAKNVEVKKRLERLKSEAQRVPVAEGNSQGN
jgi:hypothetical protein